jgi:protein-S-isoprenylcysteine O-methyltransferase Ste14
MDWQHLLPYLGPVLVIALLARRLLRNEPRKIRPWGLLILPTIITLGVISLFAATPLPQPIVIWGLGFGVALAIGATAGFLTSHHQEFTIDKATGDVFARATPLGAILVVVLIAARFGIKYVTPHADPYAAHPVHPSASVLGWTDVGIMFAMGMVYARTITTWLHARPLLAAHKAQQAISTDPAPGNQQGS